MLLYPSLVILLVSAAAAQNADFGESGSLSIGDYNTPQAEQVYLNAYNNPNASQSVTFQAPGTSAGSWTWRVTVAEINIPDNHQDLGLPSANYSLHERITNTQWHLEWSLKNNSNVTLQALLGESNVDLYINAIQATFSKSALSQYSQQSNGDCTALLGSQCLQAIQVAAVENFNGGSVGNVDIQNLANCSDAFRRAGASDFSFSIDPYNSTSSKNDSATPFYSGGPLYYSDTPYYTAGNTTLYNQAVSAVNILVLSFRPNSTSFESHGNLEPAIVCQVVDKSKAVSGAAAGLGGGAVGWALFATGMATLMLMA